MKTNELEFIEIPELGIKITPKQQFNGKTYSEILEEVSESQIATYEILQKLRNISFSSNWNKYPFMKSFWVFVPNPDELSKSVGNFAGFVAYSDRANLNCNWNPFNRGEYLGVFLYCPITE